MPGFRCEFCGYKFKQKCDMKEHSKINNSCYLLSNSIEKNELQKMKEYKNWQGFFKKLLKYFRG